MTGSDPCRACRSSTASSAECSKPKKAVTAVAYHGPLATQTPRFTFPRGWALIAYLASLRAFCTWLKQTGQIPYHPMGAVKGLKVAKRFVRDSFTEAEVARLMDTFELTVTDPAAQERVWRDYAMTLLWVSTGTRSIELARAQRRHLAQRDGHPILYLHRKGGDAAEQPVVLAPWVLEARTAYFQIHDNVHHPSGGPTEPFRGLLPEHPLFCWLRGPGKYNSKKLNVAERRGCRSLGVGAIQAMILAHLQQAGLARLLNRETQNLRPISPHSLRHTAATLALNHGATIRQLQSMPGHADIQTTMINMHERDCIVNAAEHHIPNFSLPPSPQSISWYTREEDVGKRKRTRVVPHAVRPGRHAHSVGRVMGQLT